MTCPDPRSYLCARSYERVRSSSTDSLEKLLLLRDVGQPPRPGHELPRLPRSVTHHPTSPPPRTSCSAMRRITRDSVRRPAKRNFIAACYRVHGPALLDQIRALFIETGTATNLLGHLRTTEPEALDADAADLITDSTPPPPLSAGSAVPGLTYSDAERPRFGVDPKCRYDRRPSNPDAASFFTTEELGVPPRRSRPPRCSIDDRLLLGQVARVPTKDPAQLLVREPAAVGLAGALLGALDELRPKSSVQLVAAFLGEP